MKGKSQEDCHNYIRVMLPTAEGALICGTNAFAPKCREYEGGPGGALLLRRQFDGQAVSPYSPRDNATAVLLRDSNQLLAGTVSDFAGNDPLIYGKRLGTDKSLRTQRDDFKILDAPNFVSSFVHGDYVYFWFRETAAESLENDGERRVYARVGRVCKFDRGGPRAAQDRWSTFLKARLNCSLPADQPVYFNELQSVSEPVEEEDDAVLYAVFSTPESPLRMSAICSFAMSDVRRVFERSAFRGVPRAAAAAATGAARPGACVADSRLLRDVSFILRNPLLQDAIPQRGAPHLVEGTGRAALTQVAVRHAVPSVGSAATYTVLWVGTADGRVLKLVAVNGSSVLVQSAAMFAAPVVNLVATPHRLVAVSGDESAAMFAAPVVNLVATPHRLVAVSGDEVVAVPLHDCGRQTSCAGCLRLRDPFCAWDERQQICTHHHDWDSGSFVQNVAAGFSELCRGEDPFALDDFPALHVQDVQAASASQGRGAFSSTFFSVVVALLVALAVGVLIGYKVAGWRHGPEAHSSGGSSSAGSDYDFGGRARLTRHDSLTAAKLEHVYSPGDAVSLVLTLPAGGTAPVLGSVSAAGSGGATPRLDRSLAAALGATLPRDYKVRKVYL
uniref:Sema domain-containing protein n=1 Tax=Steinernema glaseri TaxID=37863 RepID=A0A1I7YSW1_9BILA